MSRAISNFDDYVDSRDVDARIEELLQDQEDKILLGGEREELRELQAFKEEAIHKGVGDWEYGAQLVHESYFVEHARELAEETGAVDSGANGSGWPLYCIDWEQAARDLRMDYTEVDWDGVTYLAHMK